MPGHINPLYDLVCNRVYGGHAGWPHSWAVRASGRPLSCRAMLSFLFKNTKPFSSTVSNDDDLGFYPIKLIKQLTINNQQRVILQGHRLDVKDLLESVRKATKANRQNFHGTIKSDTLTLPDTVKSSNK